MASFMDRFASSLQKTFAPQAWLRERLILVGVPALEAEDISIMWRARRGSYSALDRIVQLAAKGAADLSEVTALMGELPGIIREQKPLTFERFVHMVRSAPR